MQSDHSPDSELRPDHDFLDTLSEEENSALERVLSLDLRDLSPAHDAVLHVAFNPFLMPVSSEKLPRILEHVKSEMGFSGVRPQARFDPDLIGVLDVKLVPGPCTHMKLVPIVERMAKAMIASFMPRA